MGYTLTWGWSGGMGGAVFCLDLRLFSHTYIWPLLGSGLHITKQLINTCVRNDSIVCFSGIHYWVLTDTSIHDSKSWGWGSWVGNVSTQVLRLPYGCFYFPITLQLRNSWIYCQIKPGWWTVSQGLVWQKIQEPRGWGLSSVAKSRTAKC